MDSSLTSPLRITAWPDAVIDRIGHLPGSPYFEWTGTGVRFEAGEFLSSGERHQPSQRGCLP